MSEMQQPVRREIEVMEPLGRAWRHMKSALFPFQFKVWITLGFVAWLASPGANTPNFNFGNPLDFSRSGGPGSQQDFSGAAQWIESHMRLILLLGGLGLAIVLAVVVFFSFLRARATFVYLRNVHQRTAEVVQTWRDTREIGNSLFVWRVAITLTSFILVLILIAVAVIQIWPMLRSGNVNPRDLLPILFIGLVAVPIFFALGLASWVLTELLAPIMYLRNVRVGPAFALLRGLVRGNFAAFLLFWLMNLLLGIMYGALAMVAVFCTCCIGGLPVIHQTVLQPFLYWFRAYPLFFLAQFGPEYPAPPGAYTAPQQYAARVVPIPSETLPPRVSACPHCGQQHSIPDGQPGLYSCVRCGGKFEVK